MNNDRYLNKVAVVIGGNSGMGLSTAEAFAREGARVVITGREQRGFTSILPSLGDGALALRLDISEPSQITAAFDEIQRTVGTIDALFVNAGIGRFAPVADVSEVDWDAVMNVNLKGTFFLVQRALPLLRSGSAIVLNASVATVQGVPSAAVYSASKAAVRSLARTFAAEFVGKGIRVNVVSPGPIDTPIFERNGTPADLIPTVKRQLADANPMKRLGTPDEIAKAVLFLASSDASYITGVELFVDGGLASL
jgi:NAD(P)-dependent dehydrogenase (short-subunit alcohol dehydrogenase family)